MVTKLREWALEWGWLLLVILLFSAGAARTVASNYVWEDENSECSDSSGWCEGI